MIFREADIVYDEKLDPIIRKMRIAHIIARRMAQKCISNLLSPSYWFDQWLNEGFKIYFETYIIEKVISLTLFQYAVKTINSLALYTIAKYFYKFS